MSRKTKPYDAGNKHINEQWWKEQFVVNTIKLTVHIIKFKMSCLGNNRHDVNDCSLYP